MEQGHRSESRSRLAWRETNRQLSQWRPNWRKTAKNLVFSWQRNTRFHRKQPRDYYGCRSSLAGGEPDFSARLDGRGARPSIVRLSVRLRVAPSFPPRKRRTNSAIAQALL